MKAYAVGIDLGTTNAALSYVNLTEDPLKARPSILPIGQWVSQGVWQEKPLFPTFRYQPLPSELDLVAPLPFAGAHLNRDSAAIFGEYALKLGALNPGQGIASAKSWLSQAARVQKDAHDAFLPVGTDQNAKQSVELVSPVVASASYLRYLHGWWNHQFKDHPLVEQEIVITVPASFDEYARDLTRTAAEMAGLSNARFLEEPTAAVYAWINSEDRSNTHPGVMCVVDVGGGTTDFSVVDFKDPNAPKRIAVGDHLMLGGDNVDGAVAKRALESMQDHNTISPAQWSALTLAAREAKEQAFGTTPPDELKIGLLGRGKSLVGRQRQAVLNTSAVQQMLLQDFMPEMGLASLVSEPATRAGLVQVGLKFEGNTAITAHLSQFLHGLNKPVDSVLLNGGFFQGQMLRDVLEQQLKTWSEQAWAKRSVAIFWPSEPQFSVAQGAALYCFLRQRQTGVFIGGGAPRSLILQVASDAASPQGVVVMAKGAPEGIKHDIATEFHVRLNESVEFVLHSCADFVGDIGDVVPLDPSWLALPPLQTRLESSESDLHTKVQAKLCSELTNVGVLALELKSMSAELPLHTSLEFAGRSAHVGMRLHPERLPLVWSKVQQSIESVFGPGKKDDEKAAMARLRKLLDSLGPRHTWDMTVCRSLVDLLLMYRKNRRRSAKHESLWLSLVGFGIRPGKGAVGDVHRLELIWEVLRQPPGNHEHSVWHAWWTLARRCSFGLSPSQQRELFSENEAKIRQFLDWLALSGRQKSVRKTLSKKEQDLKTRAPEAMLPAISSLTTLRGQTWFERQLFKVDDATGLGVNPQILGWCCANVMAPTEFGALEKTTRDERVKQWLRLDWSLHKEFGLAASLAVQVRHSEPLDEAVRVEVETRLKDKKLPKSWSLAIRSLTSSDGVQEALSKDRLPLGIGLNSFD